MVVARDDCVVDNPPLAGIVRAFVSTWNRGRPPTKGQFGPRQSAPLTALEWLVQETGYRPKQIERVIRPGVKMTPLAIADALVTAIGCPEAFANGTLEVRPNPQAPAAARARCCGGSLTGGLL